MKSFRFPLERVLGWQHSRRDLEEMRLKQLYGEQALITAELERLRAESTAIGLQVLRAASVSGAEASALGAFQARARRLQDGLEQKRQDCARRIEAKRADWVAARRDCRMLEKLRERRLDLYRAELDRETESAAAESYLARICRGENGA